MKFIHKTRLLFAAEGLLSLPVDAKILTAQIQDDDICIWYEFENISCKGRPIFIVGTGHPVPAEATRYISTVQIDGFVWHIYECAS